MEVAPRHVPLHLCVDSQLATDGVTLWLSGWIRRKWRTKQGSLVSKDPWQDPPTLAPSLAHQEKRAPKWNPPVTSQSLAACLRARPKRRHRTQCGVPCARGASTWHCTRKWYSGSGWVGGLEILHLSQKQVEVRVLVWRTPPSHSITGQLPMLEVDGKEMTQSAALLRWIASKGDGMCLRPVGISMRHDRFMAQGQRGCQDPNRVSLTPFLQPQRGCQMRVMGRWRVHRAGILTQAQGP